MFTLMKRSKHGICLFCQRDCSLTFHHLIPRKLHRRAHFRKHYNKEQLNTGIDICRQCHRGVHKRYDEMTLGKQFSTQELLQADEDLQRHFEWVSKQRISD